MGVWCLPETVLSGEMKRQHADRVLGTTHAFIASVFGILTWARREDWGSKRSTCCVALLGETAFQRDFAS